VDEQHALVGPEHHGARCRHVALGHGASLTPPRRPTQETPCASA
jgi:hypothetical protein